MKLARKQSLLLFVVPAILFLLSMSLANAQAPPQGPASTKGLLSDQAFKNIKVLKGIPVDEFMATMGFFSSSLAENCLYCHTLESAGDWGHFADDNPHKIRARGMIAMVNNINKTYFGGRREITCYSCHRGGQKPKITPSIAELYGPVPPDDTPDAMVPALPRATPPDQIIDKYIAALGGAAKVASIKSFYAKGIYQGFADDRVPFEEWAKAPNMYSLVVHGGSGEFTTTFDGKQGWTAGPATDRPVQVVDITGGSIDGARLDGELFFPSRIKQVVTQLRTLIPTTINDRDVLLVQGTMDGKYPVDLYFDAETYLLRRSLRYADTAVGFAPTQVDYEDYREVAGVKMPFKRTIYWLDGRAIVETSEIQPNVAVADSKFGKPPVPATNRVSK